MQVESCRVEVMPGVCDGRSQVKLRVNEPAAGELVSVREVQAMSSITSDVGAVHLLLGGSDVGADSRSGVEGAGEESFVDAGGSGLCRCRLTHV